MNTSTCPRLWEVEAARDGRLEGAAYAEFLRHAAHCRACEQERVALSRLQHALCASTPADDAIQLRRVRQRLRSATHAAAGRAAAGGMHLVRIAGVFALASVVLWSAWGSRPDTWRAHAPAAQRRSSNDEPVALRLTAENGARFEHERRGDLEYVQLHHGGLHVAFDRAQRARLSVQTPDGEIEDVGTVFQVRVEGNYTTRISVSEGAVRFRRDGQPDVILTAGQVFERAPHAAAITAASAPVPPASPQADPSAHRAPSARLPTHTRIKAQPESSSTAEDRAYLEVLDLLRAGRQEEARAAARRYCRNYPHGLRLPELEQLARSARP
jgi:ferric-dicitrate binding protein FerR (iron transport regulator)